MRISDVSNMKTALELFHLDVWKYPLPDDNYLVTFSWNTLRYQWEFWNTVVSSLSRNISEVPTDPLTDKKYIFSVANNKNEFEILTLLESDLALNLVNQTNAANITVTPRIDWTYNKVFIKTPSHIVPVPSIINSEVDWGDLILDADNIKSQIVSNWGNVPDHGNVNYSTWELSWLVLSVYTWSLTSDSSSSEKSNIMTAIHNTYTGSSLTNTYEIAYLLTKNSFDFNWDNMIFTYIAQENINFSNSWSWIQEDDLTWTMIDNNKVVLWNTIPSENSEYSCDWCTPSWFNTFKDSDWRYLGVNAQFKPEVVGKKVKSLSILLNQVLDYTTAPSLKAYIYTPWTSVWQYWVSWWSILAQSNTFIPTENWYWEIELQSEWIIPDSTQQYVLAFHALDDGVDWGSLQWTQSGGNGDNSIFTQSENGWSRPFIAVWVTLHNELTQYYITTSDLNNIDISNFTEITSASISDIQPAWTSIKSLISFNWRITWKKWDWNSWEDHVWGTWSLQTWNTISEIETWLTNLNITTEQTLDFAFDLSTDNTSITPEINWINITYSEGSMSKHFVHKISNENT